MQMKAMRQQISSACHLMIQSCRLQGGIRRVTHITEVCGMEQDTIVLQDIYRYVQEGIDETGRAGAHLRLGAHAELGLHRMHFELQLIRLVLGEHTQHFVAARARGRLAR